MGENYTVSGKGIVTVRKTITFTRNGKEVGSLDGVYDFSKLDREMHEMALMVRYMPLPTGFRKGPRARPKNSTVGESTM